MATDSIGLRIALGVIGFVLVCAIVITFGARALIERGMTPSIGSQQYQHLRTAADRLDDQLRQRQAELRAVGEALQPKLPGARALLRQQMLSQPALISHFWNLTIAGADGQLLADVKGAPDRAINFSARGYFADVVRTGKAVVSDPIISPLSGKPVVIVAVPLMDGSRVRYVVSGSMELEHSAFLRAMESVTVGKTGIAYLMTSKAIVISHPETARIMRDIREGAGTSVAAQRALQGYEGWLEAHSRQGQPAIYAITRLKSVDWILVGRYPAAEAFAPIAAVSMQATVAALFFAAFAGTAALLLARRIVTPIVQLTRKVAAIEHEAAAPAALLSGRSDEIGLLSNQFHRLVIAQEANQRRLQLMADSMPALIAYIDGEQRYRFSNAHYRVLLGIEPASVIGRTIREVLGETMYAELEPRIAAALKGERCHFEVSRHDPGRAVHFMTDFIPDIDADGAVNGFYTLVLDISERKEAELRQAASEQRAESASRAKTAFVTNISHEIRTPMNAVLGIAQLMERTPLSADQKEYLDIIRVAGLSLIEILNNVLDLAKIESGRIELERAQFDIETVLEAAAALFTASAGAKDIDVAIGIKASTPRYWIGDGMRTQQIVINLVSNALKFTTAGYVALEVEGEQRDGIGQLSFTVADSGIGISEEQRTRIFDAFEQADTSTTRKFGGTGLGLAITRHLTAIMGGEIRLTSVPGEGSAFTVRLPVEVSAGQHADAPTRTQVILLIDAEATTRKLFLNSAAFCGIGAYAYESEQVALAAAATAALDLSVVTHVLIAVHVRVQPARICAALFGHGLPADALIGMVCTPYERQVQGDLLAATGLHIVPKPLTPRVLRHAVNRRATSVADGAAELSPAVAGMRVLLVEDNAVNQMVVQGFMAHLVRSIELAGNGAEAVAKLRAQPRAFDLVLMDIQMPVMDGLSATRAIRQELGLQLPIVAMTAGVMQDQRGECDEAGMNDFLAKPIELPKLRAILNQYAAGLAGTGADSGRPMGVFDTGMLQAALGDDPGQRSDVVSVVRQGLERARAEMASAQAGIAGADARAVLNMLHSMRGALGTLGAQRFVKAALQVEGNLREGKAMSARTLDQVSAEFGAFAQAADAWLALNKTAVPPG